MTRSFILLSFFVAAGNAAADSVLIRHATVHTESATGTLEGADLLITDGVVAAVGQRSDRKSVV